MTDPHGALWVASLADGRWAVFWSRWKDGAEPMWAFWGATDRDRADAWNTACSFALGAVRAATTGEPLLEGGVRLKTA